MKAESIFPLSVAATVLALAMVGFHLASDPYALADLCNSVLTVAVAFPATVLALDVTGRLRAMIEARDWSKP